MEPCFKAEKDADVADDGLREMGAQRAQFGGI